MFSFASEQHFRRRASWHDSTAIIQGGCEESEGIHPLANDAVSPGAADNGVGKTHSTAGNPSLHPERKVTQQSVGKRSRQDACTDPSYGME